MAQLLPFRNRHIEAVEGRGHEAVEAHEINELVGSVLTKGVNCKSIERLGQRPTPHELIRKIERDILFRGEVGRLQVCNKRRSGFIPSRSATAIWA